MNFYNEIKQELINNEIYKRVKDYSKNRSDLMTYYNVGKLLNDAGKHYGEGIIKDYSHKLTAELGKGYTFTSLTRMKKFYILSLKLATLSQQLTYGHYVELLPIKDLNKINYYIKLVEQNNLSIRELREKIKNKEFERLSSSAKEKIKKDDKLEVHDFIKDPIIINSNGKEFISEKILKQLILEDLDSFLKELGIGFSYIGNEYKIKIGNRYNYIDILLYNFIYNCYVVVELKVTELKKEHLGQIQVYMNYIDKNLKLPNQDKTIGIIITKKGNDYVIEYSSDDRIYKTSYILN